MNHRKQQFVSGQELWEWRQYALETAIAANVPQSEVDWLLREAANLDRLALRLQSFKDRPQVQLQMSLSELTQLWQQRIDARKPVQYLMGTASWRYFSLAVSSDVLIPRPETEYLIELAETCGDNASTQHWADLGTGSGAIALGLAEVFPAAEIHAVDCSSSALAIAQLNAQHLGFADRIHFYHGSWWQPLAALKGQLSGMVSNPPYIPSSLIPQLQPEVAWHEPHLALDGGSDGLDCIRHLVETAPDYLQPGGVWMIEMMAGQADSVAQLLQDRGSYGDIQIHADLAGIDRFAIAHRL